MVTVYERAFDWNEWFVIVSLFGLIIIWKLPKILSPLEGTAHFLYGMLVVTFYDHTISIKPWDFFDVNDSSAFQFMDFLSYITYGPYAYIFIYLYKKLEIKGYKNLLYVSAWSLFSLLMELLSLKAGVYHYDKGYSMFWSFPIYLIAQIVQIFFYHTSLKLEKAAE
ncbi:hypothetical protein [Cytobacillus sp. NCCP-133]|uniref:hypothetical protein n=1 Tax=Cytobacillus sp. NCCP-133 TaxID=766848 RepID=UPI002230AF23|nr:hypothetical protein [Cytobacillus sp. NCCP-133]GLB60823.1 hypothetical protein NCCP133_29550 [Cytobacillus sp. NCCP-133]